MKRTATYTFIAILMWSLATLAFFTFGPAFERKFMPVVTGTPLLLSDDVDGLRLAVFGQKHRPCTLTGIYADVLVQGKWVRGDIRFRDESTKEEKYLIVRPSRAAGSQLWDRYLVRPSGDAVRAVVLERCHPFWETATDFFHLDVEQAKLEQRALPRFNNF